MSIEKHIEEHAYLNVLSGGGGASAGLTLCRTLQVEGISSSPLTTSLALTDLPDMSITFTPTSATNKIHVLFTGEFTNTNQNTAICAAIVVDGVPDINTQRSAPVAAAGLPSSVCCSKVFTNLTATSHTIKIQWLVTANQGTAIGTQRILTILEFC